MELLLSLILLILLIGATVLIHEFGHFIFAKLNNVYIDEFSIGIGPKILNIKSKKDKTKYSIRMIPLGGRCSFNKEMIKKRNRKIPNKEKFESKKLSQRILIIFMGPLFNFVFAVILLFMITLIWGIPSSNTKISSIEKNSLAYNIGIDQGDMITEINDHKIKNIDDISLYLSFSDISKQTKIKVKKGSGLSHTYRIKSDNSQKQNKSTLGIKFKIKKEYNIEKRIQYTFSKTGVLFRQIITTMKYMVTGRLNINHLNGPISIYSTIGIRSENTIFNILYLIIYLNMYISILTLLPLPYLDGGNILLTIMEKRKNNIIGFKKEEKIHVISIWLLIFFVLIIAIKDIIRLF